MNRPNPSGLCLCGCGEETSVATENKRSRGHVRGEHVRFLPGHNARGENNPRYGVCGEDHPNWNGGRYVDNKGYVRVRRPDHPRAQHDGYVHEHVLVAEEALGKPLPEGAQVHHVDEDRANNGNRNLVVCQDQAYHSLLHVRQREIQRRQE